MTRFMNISIVILLFVFNSGPASAEWVVLEGPYQSPGMQSVYVDPAAMHRDGLLVTLWQLTNYWGIKGGMLGLRYQSTKTQKQFDCASKRVRLLSFAEFSGPMGTGAQMRGLFDNVWRSVDPASLDQTLWDLACSRL